MTETLTSKRNVEFTDKLAMFSLDDLRSTVKESEVGAAAKAKVFHYDFIQDICDILDKRNLHFEVLPIFVREGGRSDMPNITRIDNIAKGYSSENPLESQLIRHLTGKIQINEMTDEISAPIFGFNFNQLGQQVAFGSNVYICQNGAFFGSNLIQTYGPKKQTLKDLFFRLGEWMDGFRQKREADQHFISGMMNQKAQLSDFPIIIGDLMINATKANMKAEEDFSAPFNVSQVSDFTKEYIKKLGKIQQFPISTAWDVYNIGTRLLNPDVAKNHESILRQNLAFGDYILEYYNIPSLN